MKKALAIIVISLGISFVSITHAVNISMSLPSINGSANPCADPTAQGCSPGNYINSFYQYALIISGLIAFGAVVFGGVKYMTGGGNPSAQHEAKEWIWSALLGVVLLAGAYLILNTINPNLVNLALPTLQKPDLANTSPTH